MQSIQRGNTYFWRLQSNAQREDMASSCLTAKFFWIQRDWWLFGSATNYWCHGIVQHKALNHNQFVLVSKNRNHNAVSEISNVIFSSISRWVNVLYTYGPSPSVTSCQNTTYVPLSSGNTLSCRTAGKCGANTFTVAGSAFWLFVEMETL